MKLLVHDYAGHAFPIELSRELARRGHSVVHAFAGGLLTPRGNLQRKNGDPAGLQFIEVPINANYRRDKYRFIRRRQMEVEYGTEITALIQEVKPEVVISGQTPTEPQYRIARNCTQAGILFVPWIQDFYSVAVAKLAKKKLPVLGNLIGWWYRHLEKSTLRQAWSVVAITDDFVPMLRQLGVPQQRIVVIPNWAPLDELPERPRRNEWSAAHDLDDKFVFLYSGTLAMKHNPDMLRQLAVTFRDNSEVCVVVISEGPGADYLHERKTAENLHNLTLLPFQDFEKLPEMLATADVLVAVLEADAGVFSVPSKVLTYHCAGKPILAAMPLANLAARIIIGAGSGLCVDSAAVDDFIDAAKRFYGDPGLRERNGTAARSYAERNFDVEIIARRFEGVLSCIR